MSNRDTIIKAALAVAQKYIGTPYSKTYRDRIWPGGAMDCSSYTAAIWALAGFPLLDSKGGELRTSTYEVNAAGFDLVWPSSRAQIGKQLPSPSGLLASYGAQPGDIVFWNFDKATTRANKITHVGSILNSTTIIHTANVRENCCTKPLTYGDGNICAIIRLRSDVVLPRLPDLAKGGGPKWMVRALQAALNLRYGYKLECDGTFSTNTENAVATVNAQIGVYGKVCTAATWAALGFVNNGSVAVTPSMTASAPFYATCGGQGVNIRAGRGTGFTSLGKLPKGAPLLALPAVDKWHVIAAELNGKLITGYMHTDYVKEVKSA